jgi:hypothetical protein
LLKGAFKNLDPFADVEEEQGSGAVSTTRYLRKFPFFILLDKVISSFFFF